MKKLFCLLAALALLAQPLRAADEPKRYLALTFDDGPSGELTERLLEGLAERQVRVTFFVCGYRIAEFPDTLSHIAAAGHEIGLHSSNHDYMQKMDYGTALRDLTGCAKARGGRLRAVPGAAVPPARRALRRHAFKGGGGRGAVGHFVVGRPVRLERGRVGRRSADGSVRGARRQDHPHARPVRAFGHVRPAGRRPAAGAGIHVLHRLGAGRAARHGASPGEVYTGFPPLDG